MKKTYLMALVLVLVLLAGCMRVQTFTVAPLSAVVETGGTVAFAATDQLGNPVTVTWAVDTGPGTISAAGVYTAPATVSTVKTATITATYTSGITTVTGSAVATIIPPHFDIDQLSTTGFASANATYCPCTPISAIGSELFISLFQRNAAGNYEVISATTLVDVGDAEPAVSGAALTLTIPLADLGPDDGVTNLSSVLGDFLGATDCMPDEGAAITTSLEPKGTEPETDLVHAYFLWTRYDEFEWGVQTEPITL